MLIYRGTYRVLYEKDKTGKPMEFTYVPCGIRKGSNICRHSDDMLNVYIPAIRTVNKLLRKYPDLFKPFQIGSEEGTLIFNESMIGEAAVILKARTKGKSKSPKPKRHNVISEERKRELSLRMKELRQRQKLLEQNAIEEGKNRLEDKS